MAEMARFVKPLAGRGRAAARRSARSARAAHRLAGFARRFAALPEPQQTTFIQLLTMSSADFVQPVVRDGGAARDAVRERHHRHVPVAAHARLGVHPAAPLHGRDRRRVPRVGPARGRHRRDLARDRRGRARSSARSCARRRPWRGSTTQWRPRDRRRARVAARRSRRARSCRAPTCERPLASCSSRAPCPPRGRARGVGVQVPRVVGQGQLRALDGLPTFSCAPPGNMDVYRGMVSISPSIDYLETGLRRRGGRPIFPRAVYRHGLSELHRPIRRACRASTSWPASSSTRRTSWPREPGTSSATPLATRSRPRSRNYAPDFARPRAPPPDAHAAGTSSSDSA